jgi:hypothetical protein
MQMLFTTNTNQTSVVNNNISNGMGTVQQSLNNPSSINLNDFNTMQQIFSTTNPSMTGSFNMNANSSNIQTGNFQTSSQGIPASKLNTS